MLKKNIYILFPPGYSGTYLSWVLSKSEKHSRDLTVNDPINKKDSDQFGGAGTSHLHHRIPTHHGLFAHLTWVLYNRPEKPLIYLLNSRYNGKEGNASVYSHVYIKHIMDYDVDPVFIHLHDDNDPDWRTYAQINGICKWPIYYKGQQCLENIYGFDSFDLENRATRNILAKYGHEICPYQGPVDMLSLVRERRWKKRWYDVRHRYNPHEVNESYYIKPELRPNFLYSINLATLHSGDLFDRLDNIVQESQCGDFDFGYCRDFHHNYVESQTNLQWFDSIQRLMQHRLADQYLNSNSVIQAMVLSRIKSTLESNAVNWEDLDFLDCIDAWKTHV